MSTQFFILLALLFLLGCKSNESVNTVSPVIKGNEVNSTLEYVKVKSPVGTKGLWSEQWSQAVGNAIEDHSVELIISTELPLADLKALNCLGYNTANENDKKRFWALFLSSISLFETDFNPKTRYWERGLNVWSEGLFQLSVSTGRYHYGCEHLTSSNILNPTKNISCAVAVMRNQIIKRKSLFPSRAYYWSVLTSKKKYKVQNFFKSQMQPLKFCQL